MRFWSHVTTLAAITLTITVIGSTGSLAEEKTRRLFRPANTGSWSP